MQNDVDYVCVICNGQVFKIFECPKENVQFYCCINVKCDYYQLIQLAALRGVPRECPVEKRIKSNFFS